MSRSANRLRVLYSSVLRRVRRNPQRPDPIWVAEALEQRRLLSVQITGTSSDIVDPFRFVAGAGLPAVQNTYRATVTGTPTKVSFELGGQTVEDTNPAGGWSASFNMSLLQADSDLLVRAYEGSSLGDTDTRAVQITRIPNWMTRSNVAFSATFALATGYSFDVYAKDLDYGFYTPSSWKWQPPRFSAPLVDLSGLRTGFDTGWKFTLRSNPAGVVSAQNLGYKLHAEALGQEIWSYHLPLGNGNDITIGPATGSYSIAFVPGFNNSDLTFSSIIGSANLNLHLNVFDRPIVPEQAIPFYGVPFIGSLAALAFGVDGSVDVGFDGSVVAKLDGGGIGIQSLTLTPDVTASLSGYAEGRIGNLGPWTFAKARVTTTGTLTQAFAATYASGTGWNYSAPGTLGVSGRLDWDTVFGLFQGGLDLFDWNIASWNFINQAGNQNQNASPQPTPGGAPIQSQPGNHFTIVGFEWDDSGTRGDGDGGIEAGERPRLKIQIRPSQAAAFIDGRLGAEDSAVQVTSDTTYWDDISGGSQAWSHVPFNMNLNFDNERTENFNLNLTYRIGTQPYYQNLSFQKIIKLQGFYQAAFVVIDDDPLTLSIIDPDIDDDPQLYYGNNGDGILQSGETARIRPKIRNNGNIAAVDPDVTLLEGSPNLWLDPNDVERYPTLNPNGGEGYPLGTDAFRVREVLKNVAGAVPVDLRISWDANPTGTILSNSFALDVRPVGWLSVTNSYDFGVVAPGVNVSYDLMVGNAGSAPLAVDHVVVDQPGDTSTDFSSPFVVNPGQSRPIRVTITTTGLSGGISRGIRVVPKAPARMPDPDANRLVISGLVSDSTPIVQIPSAGFGEGVDIDGTRLVWDDERNGFYNIYLFDLLTQQERRISNVSGSVRAMSPRISGDWVAWEQGLPNSLRDVYAYNLITGQTSSISSTALDERLVGVSNGKIAVLKNDFGAYWTSSGNLQSIEIYNIYLHDLSLGSSTNLTNYGPAVIGSPIVTASSTADAADFDGDRLAWRENTHAPGGLWSVNPTSKSVKTLVIGGTPQTVVESEALLGPVVSDGRIAWVGRTSGFGQVFLWQNGVPQQLTTQQRDHDRSVLAFGGSYIVYAKQNVNGVWFWNVSTNSEELLTNSIPQPFGARMHGNGIGLKSGEAADNPVRYGFIKQPEIGVSGLTVSNPSPIEGQPVTLTAHVKNLSNFARTDAITATLYDGNPDSGGAALGTQQLLGGLAPNAVQDVTFQSVVLAAAGQRQLHVRITMAGYENPVNNTSSMPVDVQDNDVTGPTISDITVSEHNGDGDGIIGSDEQLRISFSATDPSGIGTATLLIDGAPSVVINLGGGSFEAFAGPYSAGQHTLTVTVADADNSTSSSVRYGSAPVVDAEQLSLYFSGVRVLSGTEVNLGVFAQGLNVPSLPFTIANDGDQVLTLQTPSFPPGFVASQPLPLIVPPHTTATFSMRPKVAYVADPTGSVTLPSSDAQSPFAFNVTAAVVAAPRVTAGAFRFDSRPHDIVIDFSDNVQASLVPADLQLTNFDTGASIAAASIAIAYSSLTNRAIVTFPFLPNQTLGDGNYRLVSSAGNITNQFGHPLQTDYVLDFFVLAGDANRDRSVNLDDFTALAANFGMTGRFFSQGDFTYDGSVNLDDFTILAGQFGKTLPASASFGATTVPVAALPQSAEPADINDDGTLDLVVAHQELNATGQGKVGVLLNTTPSGNLPMLFSAESQLFAVGGGVTALAVADFNTDGKPDVATADAYTNTVSVLINSTAPGSTSVSFEESIPLPSGLYPFGITTADLNEDSRPDIIAANYRANDSPSAADTISVFMNTTVGAVVSFADKEFVPVGDGPVCVEAGDLNNDGKVDLAVSNVFSHDVTVLINATQTNGTVPVLNQPVAPIPIGNDSGPRNLAITDLNRDDRLDLVTANYAHETHVNRISAILNLTPAGSGVPAFGTRADFTVGGDPIDVVAGDLDGDGADDLVVANHTGNSLTVFRNTTPTGSGTVTLQSTHTVAVDPAPIFATIRDLNGDDRPDVAVTSFTAPAASVTVLGNIMQAGSPFSKRSVGMPAIESHSGLEVAASVQDEATAMTKSTLQSGIAWHSGKVNRFSTRTVLQLLEI